MNVFISYRRKDSQYIADRIYDWLVPEFGPDNVFKDVDAIPLGRDFRRILQDAVARCDVLLVVIGPRWLGETDAAGRRRVDNPGDWVRIEIETALERDIPVIPLLVDGASFPRGEDLPPSLQVLVYRHGTPVRPDPDFRPDMGRVIKALRKTEPGVSRTAPTEAAPEPDSNAVETVPEVSGTAPTEAAPEPGSKTQRQHRLSRRILMAAVVAGVLAIVAGVETWQANKARTETRESALAASQSAAQEKAQRQIKDQARVAISRRLAMSSASERDKRLDRALLLAVEALGIENTFEARDCLFKALQAWPGLAAFLHAEMGLVSSVAFSPDGKTLAAGCSGGGKGAGVVLWDVARRTRLVEKPLGVPTHNVVSVAFSPDGKTLAAGYAGGSSGVVLWDVATRSQLVKAPLAVSEGDVQSVAFSPDGKTLAAGYSLWLFIRTFAIHVEEAGRVPGSLKRLVFSGDCEVTKIRRSEPNLEVGVMLWDMATRFRLVKAPLAVPAGDVWSVAFSPDGKTLAAGYSSGGGKGAGVVLWDVATRSQLLKEPLAVPEGDVQSVAFSPDGKTLAAGYSNVGKGAGVVLWDVATRTRWGESPLAVPEGDVRSVAFSPDGKTLAAGYSSSGGGKGAGVVLWDVGTRSQQLLKEPLAVPEGDVRSVAFSPDGKTLAAGYSSGGQGAGVVLWDVATRMRWGESPLAVPAGDVWSVAFSPDGKTLAAGYAGGSSGVVLWDVDLKSWQRRAGEIANRNFTRDEWRQYFPDTPYRPTFPDLPVVP